MKTLTLLRNSCLGLALLAGASSLNAQTYTTQTITPPPGSSAAHATAMNNAGQVVGRTTVVVGTGKKATTVRGPAFLWSGGNSVSLPTLDGLPYVEAFAISDAGLAVGGAGLIDTGHALWWENTGSGYQPHDWNDVPAAWSLTRNLTLLQASAISGDGQYVSFLADLDTAGQRDVLVKVQLDPTGKIPVLLEEYWDVSDIWAITGVRHDGAGLVLVSGLGGPDVENPGAFLWVKDAANNTTILDRHSSTDSRTGAWGVNTSGNMAGFRRNSSVDRAVVWSPSGVMQDIGTLGGFEAIAEAINDAGLVVGWASTKGKGNNDGPIRAFLWNGAVMVNLNTRITSGLTLTQGRQINNAGQILAWSGSTPVLLTPQ